MVTIAVAASAILTAVFLVKKRHLQARGEKGLGYHFLDKSLEFLIPFTIIGSLFLLLSFLIAGTSDKTSIRHLIFYEAVVKSLKCNASKLKVGVLASAGILTIIFLLNLTRISSEHTKKLLPLFKRYQKVVKTVNIIAIILFSFTFFGTQAGEPAARLRLRIIEAEKNNEGLHQELEAAVSQEVARKLLEEIKRKLPADYRDDLDNQREFYSVYRALLDEYQSFINNYNQRLIDVEAIINRPLAPDPPPDPRDGGGGPGSGGTGSGASGRTINTINKSSSGETAPDTPLAGDPYVYNLFEENQRAPVEPIPSQASTVTISEAREAVRSYREGSLVKTVKVLQSENGREIYMQLPKYLTGKVKEAAFETLTRRYPILEPILGTFFGTLDKGVETRVQKVVNKVASMLAQNPMNVAKVIAEETDKLVAETKIKPLPVLPTNVRQSAEALRRKTQSIRDATAQVKAKNAEADRKFQYDTGTVTCWCSYKNGLLSGKEYRDCPCPPVH